MTDPRGTLQRVAEETFQALAFMFPLSPEEAAAMAPTAAADAAAESPCTAEVRFSGPVHGKLRLDVSPGMLAPLAANMLGLEFDQEPTPEQQADALKELLNVICGNVLPELTSRSDVYNVDAPQLLEPAASPADDEYTALAQVALPLDAGAARLELFVHKDAQIAA